MDILHGCGLVIAWTIPCNIHFNKRGGKVLSVVQWTIYFGSVDMITSDSNTVIMGYFHRSMKF